MFSIGSKYLTSATISLPRYYGFDYSNAKLESIVEQIRTRNEAEALKAKELKEEQEMKDKEYAKRFQEELDKVILERELFSEFHEEDFNKICSTIATHKLMERSEKGADIRNAGENIQKDIKELSEKIYDKISKLDKGNLSNYFKDLTRFTNKVSLKKSINPFVVESTDNIKALIKFFKDNEKFLKDQISESNGLLFYFYDTKDNTLDVSLDMIIKVLKYLRRDSEYQSSIDSRISSLIVSKSLLKGIDQLITNKITSLEHDIGILKEIAYNMIPSWFLKLNILEGKKLKDIDKEILDDLNSNRLEIIGKVQEVI